ncbi:MAG: DUF4864 domain-containing protein [Caldimonas sp.]
MTRVDRAFASLLFAAAFGLFAAPAARAERVSVDDTKAIRTVVEAQLAAFASDDAKRAFSYAAPSIRAMFGSADRFMEMVRDGYPVVYRPASVVFLAPDWVQGQLVQGVHLTDSSGQLWLAIYQLERQPDKSWRISGCHAQPSAGKMT